MGLFIYASSKDSFEHNSTSARYIVIQESLTGQCCFDYSVVDTSVGVKYHEGLPYAWCSAPVCECFFVDNAIRICTLLNAHDENNNSRK